TLAYILTNGLDNGGGNYRLTDSIEIPSMKGETFEVPCSSDISGLVSEFTDFLADPKIHPLIKSAVSQAWILIVRPFPEGNERLARILSEIILIRAGYSFFSSVSLSALIARNGYGYFNAIANILRTENGGDLTYFIEYYLTLLSSAIDELRTQKTEKEQEVYEAEKQMAQVSLKPAPEEKSVSHKVGKYADTVKRALTKLQNEGWKQISTSDVISVTGLETRSVYRELERLRKKGFLIKLESLKTGNIYGFRDSETMIPEDNYSPEVLNLLHELKTSRSSKDRRLSEIITECLPRGIITKADYIRHNQESKWASDIKFAVMLGLAENIGKDKYRILTELADSRSNLMETQKSTLSALYEFFSDDMFSVEMAVAKLDYSSSHVSYILHQFKWLKLVDTQINDDNSYSYQLKVNPEDNPELFSAA
ncbi:MAG: Fic family protein, partial [Oscillospiraceae bacterium]|nr:Fic family protein [Oscillospiraceae bacterium]